MSGSEIALFSLSKFQLKQLRDRFRSSHKTIKKLLADPPGVLLTLLITNEVVNIAISSIITSSVARSHDGELTAWIRDHWLATAPDWFLDIALSALIASPVILLLCEITPKVIGARLNTLVAPGVANPLLLVYRALSPVRFLARTIQSLFTRWTPKRDAAKGDSDKKLKEEDFLSIVEAAHREGAIQETELQLIRNVFELDDTPVKEVATPITKVFSLPSVTTLDRAADILRSEGKKHKYSRVPVYGRTKSDIVGILYSKDLLIAKLEKEDPKTLISEMMWKPFVVSETMRLNSVFRRMRKQRTHMAIVTNEYGSAVGVVTLSDVLEALLDELLMDEAKPKRAPAAKAEAR